MLNESFENALKRLISDDDRRTVAEILDYDEDTEGGGGCETCYFEWTVVYAKYKDDEGQVYTWKYRGSFMDLVNTLISLKY